MIRYKRRQNTKGDRALITRAFNRYRPGRRGFNNLWR